MTSLFERVQAWIDDDPDAAAFHEDVAVLGLVLLAAAGHAVQAQNFPSKPLRIATAEAGGGVGPARVSAP